MSFYLEDYSFFLPEKLIAQYPLKERANSKMMVLHRKEKKWEHQNFQDFPSYINKEDLVVLNDTKVLPARLLSNDGKVEILYLREISTNEWECITRPGRKTKKGDAIIIDKHYGKVIEIFSNGHRKIQWESTPSLSQHGILPLPPYLKREATSQDNKRYQSVFARNSGSIAAPTASLHFTKEILQKIPHSFLTLHISLGTFQPIRSEDIRDHQMHTEFFQISEKTAKKIQEAKRLIAVGTSVTRVLESLAQNQQEGQAISDETDIFIHPPYQFQAVGGILTNYHLPKSTLFMLICAFCGKEFALAAYQEAIAKKYRFYSYGDCMLIL